jgi:Uma2 family endonuclease
MGLGMTTLAPPPRRKRSPKPATPSAVPLDDVQHFVFEGASWSFYEKLLDEIGNRPIRVTYDDGRLEIMSPLREHEARKRIIGRMIETLTLELGIPIGSCGSMTMRRKDLRKGAESDECYYIQNEQKVRGKKRLDFRRDPPPDLVVEIDITRRLIAREPIYAALGVPELWRFDGRKLMGMRLGPDGTYRTTEKSLAFPFLRVAELNRFLRIVGREDETSVVRAFRDWVRQKTPHRTSEA